MRKISSLVLAFALLAAPTALADAGKDSCCSKKCDQATCCKDSKKCSDSKKCTPEEKAKCQAKKDVDTKTEAPNPPKS
ncbi:MAG: hypothetical protein ACHQPI_01505 [Thermoanaerobaculia bacterium]